MKNAIERGNKRGYFYLFTNDINDVSNISLKWWNSVFIHETREKDRL